MWVRSTLDADSKSNDEIVDERCLQRVDRRKVVLGIKDGYGRLLD